jgi:hypothetical protein
MFPRISGLIMPHFSKENQSFFAALAHLHFYSFFPRKSRLVARRQEQCAQKASAFSISDFGLRIFDF